MIVIEIIIFENEVFEFATSSIGQPSFSICFFL